MINDTKLLFITMKTKIVIYVVTIRYMASLTIVEGVC